MASIIREVLNATGMKLRFFCGGMTKVGFGVTGTWAGTLTFRGSVDGLNFIAISVTPFASGTAVLTATANGNWEVAVQNFIVVEVEFTRTSGSAVIAIAGSVDSSYQEAFLTADAIYVSQSSTGANTLSKAAQANRAWKLEELTVSLSGPGGGLVIIRDGTATGTILWQEYLESAGGSVGHRYVVNLPNAGTERQGIVNTPGNAMTIVVGDAGSGISSIINAKFIRN